MYGFITQTKVLAVGLMTVEVGLWKINQKAKSSSLHNQFLYFFHFKKRLRTKNDQTQQHDTVLLSLQIIYYRFKTYMTLSNLTTGKHQQQKSTLIVPLFKG